MPQASRYVKSVKAITSLKSRDSENIVSSIDKPLDPTIALLRIWQSERLKKTHADLLSIPRYGPACNFFLNEIYGASDFSQRDNDLEYLYDVMSSVLPNFLLSLVSNTIDLNNLTKELDNQLISVIVNDLKSADKITPQIYTEAYRLCDNYNQRVRQIDLLIEIGHQVDFGTKIPLISTTLRLARGPSHRAGWGDVHDFLENGYNSFKKMGGAKKFLAVIEKREKRILDRIYDGDDNPF